MKKANSNSIFGAQSELLELAEQLFQTGQISEQLYGEIRSGRKTAENKTLYVRADFTGKSSTEQLIKESLDYKVGVTNVDKAKLPEGELMVVQSVSLGYDVTADTVTSPADVKYQYHQTDDLPAALRNSDFIVEQSQGRLCTYNIASLLSAEPSRDPNYLQGLELSVPKVIKPQKKIDFKIEVAEDLTVSVAAGNKVWVEFNVTGIIFRDRPNQ